jgi:hypothetical protein
MRIIANNKSALVDIGDFYAQGDDLYIIRRNARFSRKNTTEHRRALCLRNRRLCYDYYTCEIGIVWQLVVSAVGILCVYGELFSRN